MTCPWPGCEEPADDGIQWYYPGLTAAGFYRDHPTPTVPICEDHVWRTEDVWG